MSSPAWACPSCGASRSLAVWREAVTLERPALTCAMVPAEGGAGCELLVCTWADGRRVWAAEAEGLEDLLADTRMDLARAELRAAEAECDAADALADDDPAAEEAQEDAYGRLARALVEHGAALNESVRAANKRFAALARDAEAMRETRVALERKLGRGR